jgi:hypothetical protein
MKFPELRAHLHRVAAEIGWMVEYGDPYKYYHPRKAQRMRQDGTCLGITLRDMNTIVIAPTDDEDAMTRVLAHELAHALGAYGHRMHTNEVTAETVAHLVCKTVGYDTSNFSEPYVLSHLRKGGKMDDEFILHIATSILKGLA